MPVEGELLRRVCTSFWGVQTRVAAARAPIRRPRLANPSLLRQSHLLQERGLSRKIPRVFHESDSAINDETP
jgi:hypothetical protein